MNYNAANEFLQTRLSLPTELSSKGISESLPPAIRAHCFFSARVAEARVLEELRSVSDLYSAGELSLAEGRKALAKWLDAHAIGDPKSARMSNIASSMRLDLILRQNAAMAAAVGRYQVSRDPDIEERWPCWRYIAGHNPRPEHKALDGKVIRKDDPFWHSHYPPWDFNCNCDVEDSDEKPDPTPQHDDHAPASGFQFDPAHAFEEFDFFRIKDDDLREKAKSNVRKMLGETHPEYKNIDFRNNKKPVIELNAGLEAVGSVWKKKELQNIPVNFMHENHKDLAGVTITDAADRVKSVSVYSNSEHPALTFVHETGHVIDKTFLKELEKKTAKQKVLDFLKSSEGYKNIQREHDLLIQEQNELKKRKKRLSRSKREILDKLEYELNDEEVFARGFVQYIAEKKTGIILDEFKNDVTLKPDFYIDFTSEESKKTFHQLFDVLLDGIL